MRGSWVTQQRLPYNPNLPRKQLNKNLQTSTSTQSPPLISTRKEQYIYDLLKHTRAPAPIPTIEEEEKKEDESYFGYERWLPTRGDDKKEGKSDFVAGKKRGESEKEVRMR